MKYPKDILVLLLLSHILTLSLAQDINNGLTAHYLFDGNANDNFADNHGSAVGVMKVADRFGNPESAYYCNGIPGSYINLGSWSALKNTAASISLWVNIDTSSALGMGYLYNPILVTKNGNTNDYFEAYCIYTHYPTNKLRSIATQPSPIYEKFNTTDVIEFDHWYNVVLTYDDDSLRLFIDGQIAASVDKGFTSQFNPNDSVMIGFSADTKNTRYFNGAVDDLRFYDRVLSQIEIEQIYTLESKSSQMCLKCNDTNLGVGSNALKYDLGSQNTALGMGSGRANTGSGNLFLGYNAGQYESRSNRLHIGNNAISSIITGDFSTGFIGIGIDDPESTLHVNGTIKSREIVVDPLFWPDYVFDTGYNLMPLDTLSTYIAREKHLPGIPPAKELLEYGLSVGKMQVKLLEKIEELTLYLLALKEENEILNQKLGDLENQMLNNK